MITQADLPSKVIDKPQINFFKLRAQIVAYLFLLPAFVLFALLNWYPMIITVINSFQKVSLNSPSKWVGTANFARMFGNPLFYTAWRNIAEFAVLSILIGYLVPIVVAIILNEMRGPARLFQVLVYVPSLVPIAIALLVWRQIYAPEGGPLNGMLGLVGIEPQLWLQNPALVKPAIIVILTWIGAGSTSLIYLSALQEIPSEIYEASELDGFSPRDRIWYITLPLLRSRMLIMLVLQIIFVSQLFTEAFILTSGGPANSTVTPVLEIYRTAFERVDYGLAAAWSVSMLVILSIFSAIYVWLSRRRDAE